MRKLLYTVVLSYISTLLLPHAAMAGRLDPVKEMEYQKPDNVIVDVAPANPVTPVDPGEIKDTVDLDNSIKDFDDDSLTGSIGSITDIIGKGDAVLDSDKVYTGSEDLSCKSINCADLGYSQASVAECAEYVRCPFDVSYKICVKYNDEYALTKCPAHAVCSTKYKFTGCEDGYTMMTKSDGTVSCTIPLDPSSCLTGYFKTIKEACASSTLAVPSYKTSFVSGCYAACTLKDIADDLKNTTGTKLCTACPACSSGEEQVTLDDGTKKCVKTACGVPFATLGSETATLENGKMVVVGCTVGYTASTDSNGCITCKSSGFVSNICPSGCLTNSYYMLGSTKVCCPSSGKAPNGTTCTKCTSSLIPGGTTCPAGTYNSTQACNLCLNGHKESGTSGCYTCCTAEENTTSYACLRCWEA